MRWTTCALDMWVSAYCKNMLGTSAVSVYRLRCGLARVTDCSLMDLLCVQRRPHQMGRLDWGEARGAATQSVGAAV